ncbi:MAG TPA: alkaline phosphatase family protein, partial [Pirellulales bacterium]
MPTLRHLTFAALAALLAFASSAEAQTKSKHVLVIGIDGCRPDALEAAKTPNLDALAEAGARAIHTDILAPRETPGDTVSGPGWSNLLTGVWPDKHGAVDNGFKGTHYDEFPHFFARIKEARPDAVTVSFSTWKPIEAKILSAADEHADFESKGYGPGDQAVKEAAVEMLGKTTPTAAVIYFGQVDHAGHSHGFHPTVPEYLAAIETVD